VAGDGLDGRTLAQLRSWARRLGLPSPRHWHSLGRVATAMTLLQGDPSLTTHAAARSAGFSDGAALSHACGRVCGLPPSAARHLLGWEWMLTEFLAQ
jgi:methylphosphotriester-DNA--protein-cysteine methyltransferase